MPSTLGTLPTTVRITKCNTVECSKCVMRKSLLHVNHVIHCNQALRKVFPISQFIVCTTITSLE